VRWPNESGEPVYDVTAVFDELHAALKKSQPVPIKFVVRKIQRVGVALLALGDLEGARRQIERMLSARQELAMPPNTTLD
jgi:hypothetical protein